MARVTRDNVDRIMQYVNEALARRLMAYRYSVQSENNKLTISRRDPDGNEAVVVQGMSTREAFYTVKGMYQIITDNTIVHAN